MSGAFAYKMTVNLGCLNPHAIRSLKKVFKVILQSTFWHRFSFGCPSYISNIRSLSFLPHALGSEGGWRQISVGFLCHALEITTQDLNVYCESPLSIRSRYPMGHWIAERALEHRLSTHQGLPTRLRHLSCWNINSWQYPKPPQGDSKMRWVKRLVRKGPVLLQETKWTGGQEEILAQYLPGVTVCSAPPIYTELGNPSGGTTVLVPAGWQVGEKTVLIPGKAVAVLLTDRCCQFYLVSVYLHPDQAKEDLCELVRAWTHFDKVTSRALLCGDFNRADSADKEGWEQFLHRAALCDVAPYLQTHVSPNAVSSLDRCLISEDWISSAQWNPLAKATHTMNFGHKIAQLQLRIRPTVLNNPRHPKHEIIPASVFMPGKDGNPAGAGTEALQSLIRLLHRTYHQCIAQSLLAPGRETCYFLTAGTDGDTWNAGEVLSSSPGCTSYSLVFPKHDGGRVDVHSQSTSGRRNVSGLVNSHLSISACFWAWWKTQPNPKQNETVAPAWLARKYLGGQSQYVNVPKEVVHDLINRSKGVVLADTGELTACGNAFVLPRLKLYDMLEVIDTLHSGSGYLPIDETNAQARGIGNMVAFWERMRSVCPRISTYNGPILTREGTPCRTAEDLDAAMLATREFWFESPIAGDVQWESVLDAYGSAMPWPSFPPPSREVFLHTLLHTKDSSPGPDGIPYAAWRLLPEATVMAMDSYLLDILNGSALPPVQVGVWIPKAKLGPTADFFRPLGMPNTIDRLVDGAIATQAMKHTSHLMHPSQTVMSLFKEPQRAVAAVQQILDSDTAAAAILIDLSKAFERVNPHWILRLLRIKRAPHWIVTYARFVLFGRRVTHKVQGRLLPSRAILQGVDMGRSFSVYLFCLAMDPVFHYLNRIPGVISVQGYVDDTTIVGSAENAEWLCEVSRCYQQLRTAGFVVDGHSCYRSCRNSSMKFPARLLTGEELLRYWPQIDQAAKFPTATTDLFLCLARPGALSPGVTGQGARVDPHQNTMESLTDPQHQEHQNSPTHQQRCSDLENRLPDNNLVCIACGCGDCTVGHWVRWCLIPIASAHRLLGLQEYRGSLDVLAGISSRNLAICSLVVFHFRRLLRQEGAFFHQTRGERHSPLWWCRKLCHEVSLNAHIQLQVRIEEFWPGVPACTCSDEGVYLVRTLPVHLSTFLRPPLVVQAARSYEAGDTLAKVCLSSIILAALQATAQNVQGTNHNVLTSYYLCRCGEYHVEITAARALAENDVLSVEHTQSPIMLAQFDGSAHSQIGIGGAGAALFRVSFRGLELVDWCSYALPKCADNVEAEAQGALAALRLYQEWVALQRTEGELPHALHTVQGDIKPLLQHLQFTGRLRRSDLITTIDNFHQTRSLIAPACQMLYRPREANFIADYLAGQGSKFLLDLHKRGLVMPEHPLRLDATPPISLLLKQQAVLLGTHKAGKTVMCLVEQVTCSSVFLYGAMRHPDERISRGAANLITSIRAHTSLLAVEYVASAEDGVGRLYARQVSAQRMPRLLRLAAYGSGHQEVDMTGAHYEIVRRSIEKCSLPPIQKLRELLRSEWSRTGCVDFDEAIKLWPLCVINGGMQAGDDQLRRQQLVTTPAINAIAYELTAACAAFTTSVLPCLRSRLPTCFRNRAFFATEYVECMAMQIFLVQLQQRVTLRSVIWLHDGVWIPSEVEERDIRFAESVMLQAFSVRSEGETLLHVCQLDPYAEQAIQLLNAAPRRDTAAVVRKGTVPKHTRDHPHANVQTERVSHANNAEYLERQTKRPRYA